MRIQSTENKRIRRTEQALAPDYLLHDVNRPSELTRLVLKPGRSGDQPRAIDANNKRNATYLILTSSNGTTTKLSVAPAAHPVATASDWFIFFCTESARNCLQQKSLAALYAGECGLINAAGRSRTQDRTSDEVDDVQFGSTLRCLHDSRMGDQPPVETADTDRVCMR